MARALMLRLLLVSLICSLLMTPASPQGDQGPGSRRRGQATSGSSQMPDAEVQP